MKLKKYFKTSKPSTFAIVGGASANLYLRSQIETLLKPHNAQLLLSELKYCSDNAAMIGRVAIQMYEQKMFTSIDKLQSSPRSSL
jgi:N6-L-threonylcarbamoyladenine synthase